MMLTRRVKFLQHCPYLKLVHSRKSTKVNVSELAYPIKERLPEPKPKLASKKPIIKEFFVGNFEKDLLTYPEPQTEERHRDFEEWLKTVADYMKSVDGKEIYKCTSFPEDLRENLRELGVYGAKVPHEYEGMDLLDSEYLRLVETLSIVPRVGWNFLQAYNFPVTLLKKFGTVEQKLEYLSKIATGHYVPIICVNETESRIDPKNVKTKAHLSMDEKTWSLSGQKIFTQQDTNANLFIVYAQAHLTDDMRKSVENLSAFIVSKDTPGVSELMSIESPWLGRDNMFQVKFNNVILPRESLIGKIGDGLVTLEQYYTNESTYASGVYMQILRSFIQSLARQAIKTNTYEREMVKNIIGKSASTLYVMESIAYLTSSFEDLYENQDLIAERALVHEFCASECIARLIEAFRLLETHLSIESYPFEEVMRNQMFGMQGISDVKSYVGLLGMKHAGKNIAEFVKKFRNPFEYPAYLLKNFFSRRPVRGLKHRRRYLEMELHPSLEDQVWYLEDSLAFMQESSRKILVRHGAKTVLYELDLQRLTEMASLIYGMTAVLGRVSRSYCIGLRNSQCDMNLALAFLFKAHNRIELLNKEIDLGEYINSDQCYRDLAQRIYEMKEYCLEHPLAKN